MKRLIQAVLAAGLLTAAAVTPAHAADEYLQVITIGKGCLVPLWGSKDAGAYVGYEVCDNTRGQAWRTIDHGGSWYSYQSVGSDLCLTVLGGGTLSNEDIVQQPCAGAPNQRWQPVYRGAFQSPELHPQHSGKCLSIEGNNRVAPADLRQMDCGDVNWQKWNFFSWPPPVVG
ncbi:Ricin-type beta-trefoil lectin domain-containing protein [Amycolatopsis xylanica]|uniref:Ricin-type beta-trefoil lectin domain-containing protein n=1 Tax=Amycolatopsis xylanica TaxID=589385 RepID=A0A1H3PJF4_9PSEU|nr:RICIN domain-containing protein [Amycolatopsis xylanica]SDZ01103.1 Ricin-type beta-trefoil lectin domain-containing protein [Amycolatopsis xylanica]